MEKFMPDKFFIYVANQLMHSAIYMYIHTIRPSKYPVEALMIYLITCLLFGAMEQLSF